MTHFLLTGATGVIGSAVLPRLLEEPNTRVTALVRASSSDHLHVRAQELLDFCSITDQEALKRIHFVRGDVCQPKLGLQDKEYNELANSVTGIVHSAGNVKLNQPIEVARQNACRPVIEILNLARAARFLRKIDAVTTIGVAGRMPGLIPERRLVEARSFHNNYEQSKAEAEELLWEAIGEGLPITIHRPSMVVGDSITGKVASYQVFYYLCEFLTGKKTFGFLPDLTGGTLDIVPVDYAADAIAIASNTMSMSGRVLHLCSGPQSALQLEDLPRRLVELSARQERQTRPFRRLPRACFRLGAQMASIVAPAQLRRTLKGLPYFLDYLVVRQDFDVKSTHRWLVANDINLPSPEVYLEPVLGAFWESTDKTNPARESLAKIGAGTDVQCSAHLKSNM